MLMLIADGKTPIVEPLANFNTSHVNVNPVPRVAVRVLRLFQYISC